MTTEPELREAYLTGVNDGLAEAVDVRAELTALRRLLREMHVSIDAALAPQGEPTPALPPLLEAARKKRVEVLEWTKLAAANEDLHLITAVDALHYGKGSEEYETTDDAFNAVTALLKERVKASGVTIRTCGAEDMEPFSIDVSPAAPEPPAVVGETSRGICVKCGGMGRPDKPGGACGYCMAVWSEPKTAAAGLCGRCGHGRDVHGGMPGPALGATNRDNASRCRACDSAGHYCERWTASYGPPPSPAAPTAEAWVETLTPMLMEARAQIDALKAERDKYRDAARLALLQRDEARAQAQPFALQAERDALADQVRVLQGDGVRLTEKLDAALAQRDRYLDERDALAGELRGAREREGRLTAEARSFGENFHLLLRRRDMRHAHPTFAECTAASCRSLSAALSAPGAVKP